MKRILLYLGVLLFAVSLFPANVSAQAPSITYNPGTNALSVGVPFSIAPTNAGGAVPATVYGTVSTFAGSTAGTAGRANGTGTAATFNLPRGTSIDASGNQYVSDAGNNEIREITSAGVVTLLAGSATGAAGRVNGTGTAATFDLPYDATADASGNLYVADYTNNEIRKIVIATGAVTLLAGSATGVAGTTNGTGAAALFNGPVGIVYNPVDGNLYVSDFANNEIRKVTTAGVVTLLAGSTTGATGTTNATGNAARFNGPNGIAVDASGNLYVADQGNNEIRKVTTAGVVTLFAGSAAGTAGTADGTGTAATFNTPRGVTVDPSGNLYITDSGNNTLRLISPAALVTTFAGKAGTAGYVDAVGTAAEFNQPRGLDCDPATGNLYIADYTNNVIRQVITTGYLISATLPAGLSFDNTTGIISGTPTGTFGSTTYTIYAFNATGSSNTTVTLSCTTPTTTTWLGKTNTTWTTASNWSNGVPTAANGMVAEIGTSAYTGAKVQPTISASTTIKSLVFGTNNSAVLTLSTTGVTLTVSSGMGVQAIADVSIDGPGTLSLAGASSVSANGSLTVGSNCIISLAANSQLVNNGSLELTSTANGSASIAAVPSTSTIAGTFTVDRYITGGTITYRGYRLFSSPVNSGSGDYSISYLKNSIYITATTTTGGFDNTAAANPTIYLYRENLTNPTTATFTGSNFRGVNDINSDPTFGMNDATYPTTNIPVGNGFLCFFRGNRASTTFANETKTTYVPQTATLSATGSINYGNITVSDWFTPSSANLSYTAASPFAGYNLVGNPYPSSIDWDKLQYTSLATGGIYATSTVSKTIYVLDPISHNFGAYISGGGSGSGTNNATNIIVSGQGFFVVATGTTPVQPQLTFTETAKTTTQNTGASLLMGTPVNLANNQFLKLRLAKDTANADETVISFNSQASTKFNPALDAPYKSGYGIVSLAGISQDNVQSAIHNMPLPKLQGESVGLNVSANATGIYSITLKDIVAVPRLYDVWLMDKYKKDSLDMRENLTYNFNIDRSDTASFGANRFTLMIRQNPAYAYQLLSFSGSKVPDVKQVQLSWNTANEGNYTNFTVEHSIDGGKTYNVLGSLSATGAGQYGLLDKSPADGQNLYRLKQEDVNNTITYSNVVTIQFSYQSNSLSSNNLMIYPNPVMSTINLSVTNQTADNVSYNIRFMNSSGVVVKQATSPQPTWQGNLSSLQPGTYVIQVLNSKNETLVGETKFVKM